jgi:hypothetical protein
MNKFEVNQEVFILQKDNNKKIVSDFEFINDEYIYYMTDHTCFPENKIFECWQLAAWEYFSNEKNKEEFNKRFIEVNETILKEIRNQIDRTPSRKPSLLTRLFRFLRLDF